MAKDISFMQYMRAHGNTAGPTQRPLLTGAISGLLAFIPYEVILRLSGARAAIAGGTGSGMLSSSAIDLGVMVIAGILYAAIFKRAANDCGGGWIFGASYGFLLWICVPLTMSNLLQSRSVVVGIAAIGLFGAHVTYGLALGIVFPWIHFSIQSRLSDKNEERVRAGLSEHGGNDA